MKKRWFTLIEMLIVIVIIGILAWALIPRIWSARDKANDTAREANVRSLATAMVSYGMDHGYPATTESIWETPVCEEEDDENPGWSVPGSATRQNGCRLNVSLTAYSIPAGNFQENPTDNDTYFYNRSSDGAHFVIYSILSWWPDADDAGNCSTDTAGEAWGFDYATLNAETNWNAFCYFQ